jgi:hypothetical protein
MKQFSDVNSSYGAPMGRHCFGQTHDADQHCVRLFRVNLDSGGYDDGGAYWGIGQQLWCATDGQDYCQFTRARSRIGAIIELQIERSAIKRAPIREINTMLSLGGTYGEHLNELGKQTINSLKELGYIA